MHDNSEKRMFPWDHCSVHCVGIQLLCVVCRWLQDGPKKDEEKKGCAQASVPKLHLILEECLPGAHSNQT